MPTRSKLPTTTRPAGRRAPPLHPGEMLREEFMVPLGLSSNALAIATCVPATRIAEIVRERRGITADTALRLGRYFQVSPEFWMNVQKKYELDLARDQSEALVLRDVHPLASDEKARLMRLAKTG